MAGLAQDDSGSRMPSTLGPIDAPARAGSMPTSCPCFVLHRQPNDVQWCFVVLVNFCTVHTRGHRTRGDLVAVCCCACGDEVLQVLITAEIAGRILLRDMYG